MKTILYNTTTLQTIGNSRVGHYTVNGIRATLPSNIVELIIEETGQPESIDGMLLDFSWEADIENLLYKLVWSYIPRPPKTKDECISELETKYHERVDAGVTVENIKFGITDLDRMMFTQLLTLLNEAERIEMLPEFTTINDYDGNLLSLPTNDVRSLLVSMGVEYQKIWIKKLELHRAIALASDYDSLLISFES